MSNKSRCINSGTATMNDRLTKRGYGIMGNSDKIWSEIQLTYIGHIFQ